MYLLSGEYRNEKEEMKSENSLKLFFEYKLIVFNYHYSSITRRAKIVNKEIFLIKMELSENVLLVCYTND